MNVKKIYKKIIPPDDYEHRRDFYNEDLIDNLTIEKRVMIENMLMEDLKSRHDLLVIETLVYLKSVKSIEIIEKRLVETKEPFDKIIIAWCLFDLDKDKGRMVEIAYDNFLSITNVYAKTRLFYYLAKFNQPKLNTLLKSYVDNKNFLLANNSKRALEYGR